MKETYKYRTSAAALLLVLAPGAALAQQPAPSEPGVNDIIVTAQRRSESLQNVPIAITAYTGNTLTQKGLRDTRDLEMTTPSLNIGNQFGSTSSPVINIRGQVQGDAVITVDPSVGVYFDDVYLGRANGQITELYDIERIEVLKGPQGTLYGRNTTGGAIKIISKRADPHAPIGGSISISGGKYRYLAVDAALNLPIIADKLAVRVAGTIRREDGWSNTIITDGGALGGVAPKTVGAIDTNNKNFKSVRGSIVALPSDSLTLTLAADYTTDTSNGPAVKNRLGTTLLGDPLAGTGRFIMTPGEDFYTTRSSLRPASNSDQWGVSGTLDWDFGPTAAKLILAHRNVDASLIGDVDGSDAALLDNAYTIHMKQDSAELQLSGDAFDRVKWLIGGFWFREKGGEATRANAFFGLDSRLFASGATNRSKSIFAHTVTDITNTLSLTLGGRYTWDDKGIDNISRLNGLCPFAPGQAGLVITSATDCTLSRDAKTHFASWAVGLDYKITPDVLVYVKSGRATRSGGQQARGLGFDANAINPFTGARGLDSSAAFQPETLTDVEVGFKSLLFDRKLKFNIDYYHSWVKDQQQSTIIGLTLSPGLQTTLIANIPGTSKVEGVELDSTLKLGRFTLDVNGAYTHAQTADPRNFVPVLSPKWKESVSGTYEHPTDVGMLSANVTYSHTGMQYPAADPTFAALDALPARDIVNARVGLALHSGLSLSLWAKNLLNEKYYNFGTAFAPLGLTMAPTFLGAPREWGASVAASFWRRRRTGVRDETPQIDQSDQNKEMVS